MAIKYTDASTNAIHKILNYLLCRKFEIIIWRRPIYDDRADRIILYTIKSRIFEWMYKQTLSTQKQNECHQLIRYSLKFKSAFVGKKEQVTTETA